MTSYSQLFSGGGVGGAEGAMTAAPAPRVHEKLGILKNISILKNTSLQLIIISVFWCFSRHTSVWIKCYVAKHTQLQVKTRRRPCAEVRSHLCSIRAERRS